jgi:catechol 2,3-dioxygenase-like lactoylglutathione lyase family enzyme
MLSDSKAFSGFSVNDIAKAKAFYGDVLGVDVEETSQGLSLHLGSGLTIFVYPKPNHQPADFTILNFPVTDVDKTVDGLTAAGVVFEIYEGMPAAQDAKGVMRNDKPEYGPSAIAWFKDPAGNILSIIQE